MTTDVKTYLREWAMPHVLCPGCAHGIVLRAFLEAVGRLELDQGFLELFETGPEAGHLLPGLPHRTQAVDGGAHHLVHALLDMLDTAR